MPVSTEIAGNNRAQTERLRQLVKTADRDMLSAKLPNGWTVAGSLGHLAFWDRQRLCILKAWAAGKTPAGAYEGQVFNDAMQPLLELIPPERIAAAALEAAEEVDALLLEIPDSVIDAALAAPDPPHLNRGEHREHHLDLIDKTLAGRKAVRS